MSQALCEVLRERVFYQRSLNNLPKQDIVNLLTKQVQTYKLGNAPNALVNCVSAPHIREVSNRNDLFRSSIPHKKTAIKA